VDSDVVKPVEFPPVERRSSERIGGRELWLAHNALLSYVAGLEAAGDAMARIIGSIEVKLPCVNVWNEARRGAPKETR
jgi:hypothetical protein